MLRRRAVALLLPPLLLAIAACREREAEVWIGGDLHVGAGAGDVLAPLAATLGDGALVVNLEGPVTEDGTSTIGTDGRVTLGNRAGALGVLRGTGVVAAGIANNHAEDGGADPARTARALRAAGIEPFAGTARVVRVAGGPLAVTAHDLTGGVPPTLRADVAAARAMGHPLLATFHVTAPPLYLPTKELKEAAAIALEEGASVVAAHGTHVVGPVERRGDAVIAWGLGNLAFACECTEDTDAILLRVRLRGTRVTLVEVVPIEAGLAGAATRPSPEPARVLDLLEAIGTGPFTRTADRGSL